MRRIIGLGNPESLSTAMVFPSQNDEKGKLTARTAREVWWDATALGKGSGSHGMRVGSIWHRKKNGRGRGSPEGGSNR
ncbi:hypothetical protein TIFTF001_051936 [Ficus carica]|uniref:Uncharacterized protein n=1 Tax=Ficus carica TaxID=3494 RepID=A0AA88EJG8_FICCA|nr:hypothetical protein TIFTF001_051936 [Ficus carica]